MRIPEDVQGWTRRKHVADCLYCGRGHSVPVSHAAVVIRLVLSHKMLNTTDYCWALIEILLLEY